VETNEEYKALAGMFRALDDNSIDIIRMRNVE
jgi:hypothetical protein